MSYINNEDSTTETNHHSFIIRVWLNGVAQDTEHPGWRGYVTHVPSGNRHYFKTLEEIAAVIETYFTSPIAG